MNGIKFGRWLVDSAPGGQNPPQWERQIQCMACGAGNLRWINVTMSQRSGASEWRLYKIGNVLTGYRAALHECEGTDPA